MVQRKLIVSVVAVAAILFVGYRAFRKLGEKPERPPKAESVARGIAVRTAPLRRQDYREQLTGYGRAKALRATPVAAEVAGVVSWVSKELEAGAAVNDTEPLVKLDDRDLKQALAAAAARKTAVAAEDTRLNADVATTGRHLGKAREDLETSRRELKRIQDLREQEAATKSDLDRQKMQTSLRETAVFELEGREATLRAQLQRNAAEAQEAAAAWTKAKNDSKRAVIFAPYAGSVLRRLVQKGARVAPGTPLFELIDLKSIEIAVALPASRYGDVRPGAGATVRHGRRTFKTTVVRISPNINTPDRTFFAYLQVEGVPPGAFVTAFVEGRMHKDVFVLPRTTFVGDRVFVAIDGVARPRTPVAVLLLPSLMLAREGIAEGEQLIYTNLEEVAAGTKVAPQLQQEPKKTSDRE